MFGLSFWEISVVFIVALLVLGPAKLPGFARMIGKGLRTLRSASSDLRGAIAAPLKEIQEPLNDLRKDVYQSMNEIGKELERSSLDDDIEQDDSDAATVCPQEGLNAPDDTSVTQPAIKSPTEHVISVSAVPPPAKPITPPHLRATKQPKPTTAKDVDISSS